MLHEIKIYDFLKRNRTCLNVYSNIVLRKYEGRKVYMCRITYTKYFIFTHVPKLRNKHISMDKTINSKPNQMKSYMKIHRIMTKMKIRKMY